MGMVQGIGVISGCCCKDVIYLLTIIINFPTPLELALFLAAASLYTSLFMLKIIFRSGLCYFCTIYSKRYSKNIRDNLKKSRSQE